MKTRTVVIGLAGIVLAGTTWHIASAQGGDTPIIVSDGSIVIRPESGGLNGWSGEGKNAIRHPDDQKALAELEVTGPGAKAATCAAKGHCAVVLRWSGGETITITPRANRRGLRIESSVDFDDARWTKSDGEWRLPLPASSAPVVTIADRQGGGQEETICEGKGCSVRLHYRP
ncbi:MAG: hypothetical protein HY858_14155 [Candidatus Solibacter usitatus]|nr:hypothetical protein [Candidatus Solibacter usitatus]